MGDYYRVIRGHTKSLDNVLSELQALQLRDCHLGFTVSGTPLDCEDSFKRPMTLNPLNFEIEPFQFGT